jgi:alpha-N-arabinofuranosidase
MKSGLRLLLLLILAPAALLAQSLSRYTRSQASEARIEVRARETAPFPIPRTVYGSFLEDIGYSIFGGVSAELLDNPSLEDYGASLETLEERFTADAFLRSTGMGLPLPWLPLRNSGMRYEPRWGHAPNSHRYLYLMGLPGREVGIRQSVYLPIERELDYQGVLFASSLEGSAELIVSFRRHDAPDTVLAAAQVQAPGGGHWARVPFHLTLSSGAVKPLEPVDFAVSLKDGQRISLDEIRLYPADAVDGLDPEIIKAAKALNSPLLRFGGNFTSGYHWRDGIGPLDLRPTQLNQSWGFPEYNEFGTDELMNFCRLIGARPQICLNLGSGTVEEARAWVEYCQGGSHTPEGARRASNGHPEPYPVAAWEMGNELWGDFQIGWQTPAGYAERYRTFYRAIRSLVPTDTMIFANGADIDFFKDWNDALIREDAAELSYLTTHFVVGMEDMVNKSADRDSVWAADFAVPVGVGRALEPLRAQIDSNPATRERVKLAFTEWLFAAPDASAFPRWDNLGGALIAAGWMNMLLSHADFVPVSNMTGLMEFGGIYKRRGRVYVTPQYWAFSLYSNHAGDTVLATQTEVREYDVHNGLRRVPEIPDVPYLDALATRNSNSGALVLFVVNRDWKNAIPTTIRLKDFSPAGEARVETLTADSILVQNNEEHPDAVHPVSATVSVPPGDLRYVFPARSLTVFTFKPK